MSMSFAPEDLSHGGFDDLRGKITEAYCVNWENQGQTRPAVKLVIESAGLEKPMENHWSAGSLDIVRATDDQEGFQPVKGGGKVSDSSNAGMLFKELVNVCPDRTDIINRLKSGKISALIGLDLHWNKKARPKVDATSKDLQVLLPTKCYEQGKMGAGSGQGNGAAVDPELKDAVERVIVAGIQAAGGSLPQRNVTNVIFDAFNGKPEKGEALKLALNPSFQKAGPWKHDGKSFSL